MKFGKNILSDFDKSRELEWLETNGVGGYASSTISGANTRRYHGLLIASTNPPVGRMNVLSKLDETVVVGEKKFDLGTNQYPGTLHPKGFQYLDQFERDLFPVFIYHAGGIEIKKTIAALHGENTTIVLYEVINAPDVFQLDLLPLYASRDFHSLAHANEFIGKQYVFEEGTFRTLNYHCCPEIFISVPHSQFTPGRTWYYNFEYVVEQHRGMDYKEDLYSHGVFSVELKKSEKLGVIISTDDPTGRDAFQLFETEQKRRQSLVSNFSGHLLLKRLTLAADQFIVKRKMHSTIVAGYPWFADWGRDTMISLPGLCLVTERFDEAKDILLQFAQFISEGMMPNRFPDHGEVPEYNTMDATWWYFIASYQYYLATADKALVKELLPILEGIVAWHYKGTRFNIQVDATDELLSGGEEGVQLTWMDAKVAEWVVTPRRGKPVEINALWYNALCIMALFHQEAGSTDKSTLYRTRATKVFNSFNELFWNEQQRYLYDHVNGDYKNTDLRPNQLYAISLPFSLLSDERANAVFEAVSKHLFTSRGLRSLSPLHPDYKPAYKGDVWSRDGAYHQGTVWSYLMGAYIDALFYVKGDSAKNEASQIINSFAEHLNEAGVGTISEIFDADPPHNPRGCIAQAWSVGEILRVIAKYNLLPGMNEVGKKFKKLIRQ
jgi:predicted glycogen debranching enzyme